MDVADDVKRAMLFAPVVPQWLPLNGYRFDFFRRRKLVDITKAFAFQAPQRAAHLLNLIAHDVRAKLAVW